MGLLWLGYADLVLPLTGAGLMGRTTRRLQAEFPQLKKRYWGRHFWAIGYGAWSTGDVTDKLVQEYLEHHRDPSNVDTGNVILE